MLQVANIDMHLDRVVPALTDLVLADRPEWSVEQAIEQCRRGEWLFIVDVTGFAMCSVCRSRFTGKRQLVIEVVCMQSGCTDLYAGFWDMLARRLGCDALVMQSRRRGWERKGWTPGWTSYSRQVEAKHV